MLHRQTDYTPIYSYTVVYLYKISQILSNVICENIITICSLRILLITYSRFEGLEFFFENINHYISLDQQITASYIVHTVRVRVLPNDILVN